MELLFDSLMRDYTIGGMLLWSLDADTLEQYPFYHFIQHFHAHLRRSGDLSALKGRESIKAVVDGQQRLTALHLGLRGTYTNRAPYAREKNAVNWPRSTLHLRLRAPDRDSADDESDVAAYQFRFLTDEHVGRTEPGTWFPVPDVMAFERPGAVRAWFQRQEVVPDDAAFDLLTELRRVIWDRQLISYYLEQDQELHKVATIFQRLNKFGTPLTTAAIVFSTAVEQWGPKARTEIDDLVAQMNSYGRPDQFRFSRDFVLKACLVLSNAKSVRFDAGNYGRKNIDAIKAKWPVMRAALLATARLLGDVFGYSGSRLLSLNATIPIAYYVMKTGSPGTVVTGGDRSQTRIEIRQWLAASLVRRVFSGHSDSKLTAAREGISGDLASFPGPEIDRRLRLAPISAADIDEFLLSSYGGGAFPVLSLLYPSFRFDQQFDLDHIHPVSHAGNKRKMAQFGLDEGEAAYYSKHVNELPNLQLLRREENNEKRAKTFANYLVAQFPQPDLAARYRRENHIPDVDLVPANFREFFEARRTLLRKRLFEVLAYPSSEADSSGQT